MGPPRVLNSFGAPAHRKDKTSLFGLRLSERRDRLDKNHLTENPR